MKSLGLIAAGVLFSLNAFADTTTTGGDESATQTDTHTLYTTKGGTQLGVGSTTTVTGGVNHDGSGNIIPNNTRGSTTDTSHGVYVTVPLGSSKK